MNKILVCLGSGSLLGLVACSDPAPVLTTAEGTATNHYTHQPISGLRLELIESASEGMFRETVRTIRETVTDSAGRYHFHFDGKPDNSYVIRYNGEYYDLTSGHIANEHMAWVAVGKANTVDYDMAPYVNARVVVDALKNGATKLYTQFWGLDVAASGLISVDTARTTQRVQGSYTIRVVPDRYYSFLVARENQSCNGIYNCRTEPVSYDHYSHFIGYNDTTIIRLH